jgi:ribonuclease HII
MPELTEAVVNTQIWGWSRHTGFRTRADGIGESREYRMQPFRAARRRVVSDGLVCGIDEAGRGPIAGPVTAAAVILPSNFNVEILDDSKILTAAQRAEAASAIKEGAVSWGIGWATHEEIDEMNILRATLLAMSRAVQAMSVRPARLVVDGLYCPFCGIPGIAIIKGDASVPEIMAASILAKTARDAWMEEYSPQEPEYLFDKHKGYPTAEHRKIVLERGPSRIQRRTFKVSCP